MSAPAKPMARVLVIAGSDSGGGAGIQADIKTVTALGGYAATAVTAITVQNTQGVAGIHAVPPAIVADQIAAVLDDIGADTIKIGMLGDVALIEAVARALDKHAARIPIVVDPVMVAKGGARLLDEGAFDALKKHIIARALIITPNMPEAEVLSGMPVNSLETMRGALNALIALGPKSVLLKGGHLDGPTVIDIFDDGMTRRDWRDPKIDTPHTHGTGCTLASAIAVGVAQRYTLIDSVARARMYVRRAIETAPGFGRGHGPLNHMHTVAPFKGL